MAVNLFRYVFKLGKELSDEDIPGPVVSFEPHKVEERKKQIMFAWVDENVNVTHQFTYEEVGKALIHIVKHLQDELKLKPGDRALLLYEPSMDFILVIMACICAGVVAVPTYPPKPTALSSDMDKILLIKNDCQPKVILMSDTIGWAIKTAKMTFRPGAEKWPSDIPCVSTSEWTKPSNFMKTEVDESVLYRPKDRNEVAYLQYTSGSTGDPKGVMVTFKSLGFNCRVSMDTYKGRLLRPHEDFRAANWCPIYHDFGLCQYFFTAYRGGTLYGTSPFTFLKNPSVWIVMCSKFKIHFTVGPNFAYGLAAKKFDHEKYGKGLDLSEMRAWVSGAEPILDSTVNEFHATFERYGTSKDAFLNCFGQAEFVLTMTSNCARLGPKLDKEGILRANCGRPQYFHEVVIVDPESLEELPYGEIGEIWAKSDSVCGGYWNKPELTQEAFHGQIKKTIRPTTSTGPYLRSGDLGFMDEDLSLYVCSRIKDLIIMNGKNFYPNDIEGIVQQEFSMVRPGCLVSFAHSTIVNSEASMEVAVLAAELRSPLKGADEYEQLAQKIRDTVMANAGPLVSVVVFLKVGTIPKTTSGKVRRRETKKQYGLGTLQGVLYESKMRRRDELQSLLLDSPDTAVSAASEEDSSSSKTGGQMDANFSSTLQSMREILAKVVKIDVAKVDAHSPLSTFGMDSVESVEFISAVQKLFPDVQIPQQLPSNSSLKTLCSDLLTMGRLSTMQNSWEMARATKTKAYFKGKALNTKWLEDKQLKASSETFSYENGSCSKHAYIDAAMLSQLQLSLRTLYGLPLLLPLLVVAVLVAVQQTQYMMETLAGAGLLLYIIVRSDFHAFLLHPSRLELFEGILRFFSYRVIFEAKQDEYQALTGSGSGKVIYAFNNAKTSLVPALHKLMHTLMTGEELTLANHSAAFFLPIVDKLTGAGRLSSNKIKTQLKSHANLAVMPNGSKKAVLEGQRQLVRAALESNSSIVPCFTFGGDKLFKASLLDTLLLGDLFLPGPRRTPLLTVVGRPIKVQSNGAGVTEELVNTYLDKYLQELERQFETYKNCYSLYNATFPLQKRLK